MPAIRSGSDPWIPGIRTATLQSFTIGEREIHSVTAMGFRMINGWPYATLFES